MTFGVGTNLHLEISLPSIRNMLRTVISPFQFSVSRARCYRSLFGPTYMHTALLNMKASPHPFNIIMAQIHGLAMVRLDQAMHEVCYKSQRLSIACEGNSQHMLRSACKSRNYLA
ncbi:hypothetical protein VNO77_15323 [Canavalia gladiata]|uniref:Uncharacterized protein n=1 Tax=Canavalia gladiata TaxID=3824 RepID=A0AAN9M2L0_CANGL